MDSPPVTFKIIKEIIILNSLECAAFNIVSAYQKQMLTRIVFGHILDNFREALRFSAASRTRIAADFRLTVHEPPLVPVQPLECFGAMLDFFWLDAITPLIALC